MSTRTAIITGVTGQDGWHLSRILLEKGYRVVGVTRDAANARARTHPAVELVSWDLTDEAVFRALLHEVRPDEVYNLAARASGAAMYDDPVGMGDINGLSVARMLEGIRCEDASIRFCQASSSELFGEPLQSPQTETSPFRPRSPYGAAKLYAHEMVGIYRRRHGLFACSAILFNHESPRRSDDFVTRKVTLTAARIKRGQATELRLGNLDGRRDWGFSGDYMRGAWLMLQAEAADDFVLATGQTHSVRDLCRYAFEHVGLDYRDYVREDAASYRPAEAAPLVGDASKAASVLDWSPSITFQELVRLMVDADLHRLDGAASQLD